MKSCDLREKIGEGRYRECFALGTNLCVKKTKVKMVKTYWGFNVSFNMKLYIWLKFRTRNFNRKEYEIFLNLPTELQDYIPRSIRMEEELIIMERPRDFDGVYSKTAQKSGLISNPIFWKHVENIADILLRNNLFFLDIFYHGNNIIVKKISPDEWKPILIDVKRLGFYTYPFQLNLIFKSQQRKKFLRRMERFQKNHKA